MIPMAYRLLFITLVAFAVWHNCAASILYHDTIGQHSHDFDFGLEENPGFDNHPVNPKATGGCKMGKTLQRKRREISESDYSILHRQRRELKVDLETRGPFYIRIYFVVGFKLYHMYGEDEKRIEHRLNWIVHYADTIYRKYNIRIVLEDKRYLGKEKIDEEFVNEKFTSNSGDYLANLYEYVAKLRKEKEFMKSFDHVHLLTGYSFKECMFFWVNDLF